MVEERATVVDTETEVDESPRRRSWFSTGPPIPGEAGLLRRLSAEFLGTLLLVAVGSGAATVLAIGPAQRFESLVAGDVVRAPQDQAVFQAIFANSLGDLLPVAFAFAVILSVLVYALGGVSGAHFNPAVTLALAAVRRFPISHVPLYWIVQCAGGIAGAFVIAGIYGEGGAVLTSAFQGIDPATGQPAGSTDVATQILFGATRVAENIDFWQAVLSEAFIAFILVTAIMAIAIDPRAPKGWSGLVIGLALAAGILVTGTATGGSANFARSLGPFVASLPYDVGKIPWGDLGVFALGPVIGALAAAFVYEGVTGLERFAPAPSPGAATPEPDALLSEESTAAPGPPPSPGEGPRP